MTNAEIETIRNTIARLKCEPKTVAGKTYARESDAVRVALTDPAVQIYLDTWVIGALQALLPETRDPQLAVDLSR